MMKSLDQAVVTLVSNRLHMKLSIQVGTGHHVEMLIDYVALIMMVEAKRNGLRFLTMDSKKLVNHALMSLKRCYIWVRLVVAGRLICPLVTLSVFFDAVDEV